MTTRFAGCTGPKASWWSKGTVLISLDDLARMDVIHGPRRAEPGTYDAWTRVPRTVDPRFEFTDPPLWRSLPAVAHDMAGVGLEDHPLTATAALVWNGDLPRPLQQILFAAAGGIARRRRPRMPSRGPGARL